MVSEQDPSKSETSQVDLVASDPGPKKYGRLVRMFREGYVAVHIYMNVYKNRTFYDIVIARKIKRDGKQEYVRGANLKPSDLPALQVLLTAADEFLLSVDSS